VFLTICGQTATLPRQVIQLLLTSVFKLPFSRKIFSIASARLLASILFLDLSTELKEYTEVNSVEVYSTAEPVFLPTKQPSPLPPPQALQTPSPTKQPSPPSSTDDADSSSDVLIGASFKLQASSAPSSNDESTLKDIVASSIDIDVDDFSTFVVTSSVSSRRRLLDEDNDSGSYTWTVEFSIMVQSSLESNRIDAIETALTSETFSSEVSSSTGATVDASSLEVGVVSNATSNNNAAVGVVMGSVVGLFVSLAAAAALYLHRDKVVKALEKFKGPPEGQKDVDGPVVAFDDIYDTPNSQEVEMACVHKPAGHFTVASLPETQDGSIVVTSTQL